MKRFDTINVIPFIDIMLVLLAVVLTTASFVATNKLDINVPTSSAEETHTANNKGVEIAINKNAEIHYNENRMSIEDLEKALKKLEKTTTIALRVDNAVDFGQFVTILDLFKRLQLEKFSIITQQLATPSEK